MMISPEANRYQFTGHESDGETTLDYHGARYYSRVLGRYMSVDPLANKAPEWSPYHYVMGRALTLVDPDGKFPDEPGCCGGGNALAYFVTGAGQDLESAYNRFEFEARKTLDAANEFTRDLFLTPLSPLGTDFLTKIPSKRVQQIGEVIKAAETFKDGGELSYKYGETDFTDKKQKGKFIEAVVEKSLTNIPYVGDGYDVMIESAKQEDGLANLSNNRLINDYSASFNQSRAWLDQHGAHRRLNRKIK